MELAIDRVELESLKPWMAVWNAGWLQSVSGGTISANMSAEVADSARSVSLRGRMDLEDLLWGGGAEGSALGPLAIAADLETHSPDLSRFSISQLAATLRNADGDLAQLNAEGFFSHKEGSFSSRATARFPDLPLGLEAMGRIPSDAPVLLEAGSAELELSAERTSRNEPTRLKGEAAVRQASLAVEGNRLVRSAEVNFVGHVPPGEPRIEAIGLDTGVTDGSGANAGSVKVEGYWPLRYDERRDEADTIDPDQSALPTSPIAGKLGIRARDFDLKPWFELFGLRLEDEAGPAWPASADLTLTVDPFGEVFTLEGEERLGPVVTESEVSTEAAQTSPQP